MNDAILLTSWEKEQIDMKQKTSSCVCTYVFLEEQETFGGLVEVSLSQSVSAVGMNVLITRRIYLQYCCISHIDIVVQYIKYQSDTIVQCHVKQ